MKRETQRRTPQSPPAQPLQPAAESGATPHKKKPGTPALTLITICLVLCGYLAEILLYLCAFARNNSMPAIGGLDAGTLTIAFSNAWLPYIFVLIFVFLPVFGLVMICTKNIRKDFFALGISCLAIGVLDFVTAVCISLLSGFEMGFIKEILAMSAKAATEYFSFCGVLLTVAGSLCLSVFFTIKVFQKKRGEKQ